MYTTKRGVARDYTVVSKVRIAALLRSALGIKVT